uniref:G-protein coupled receptors family 1 profile domain-containing protein n=1 Tax=Gopherus agassizii TaxID=38772 RepID=A0A452IYL4_9SAUR
MSSVQKPGANEVVSTPLCYEVNGSCSRTLHSFGIQLAIYMACAIGMLLTVLGNLMVVIAVSHFNTLQCYNTPTNFLLFSLALADLLLGIMVLPFSTIRSMKSCWYFGDDFCRLHTFLDTVFFLTSMFHLCFIFIDRHYAICDPLLYPTKFTIRVAWLGHFLQDMPCFGRCHLLFNKLWGWLNFPLFFFPCLIMITLYVKIFIVANRQARQMSSMSKSAGCGLHSGASKRKKKAAKTLDTMVDCCYIGYVWVSAGHTRCKPAIGL